MALRIGAYNVVFGFVAFRLEVEVVGQRVFTTLVHGSQGHEHIELAPTLLRDSERRFLEYYASDTNKSVSTLL